MSNLNLVAISEELIDDKCLFLLNLKGRKLSFGRKIELPTPNGIGEGLTFLNLTDMFVLRSFFRL